jgi:hypothetical protein
MAPKKAWERRLVANVFAPLKISAGQYDHFFDLLIDEIGNHCYPPDRMFNVNETGLCTYEGKSNENRKNFLKFNLLNESGTQLYRFST